MEFRPPSVDKVNEFRLVNRKKRTGFVGLGQSGKTVLMTAIIDRVRKLNGKPEGRTFGTVTHRTGRLDPHPPDPRAFPYGSFFQSMTGGNHAWPAKTRVATRCAYLHYVEGDNLFTRNLDGNWAEEHMLLDIPGERLTDFGMSGKSFSEWSDLLLTEIAEFPEYYGPAEPFFDLIETPNAVASEVILAYKRVLAEFARSAIPLVTPSSFLIHPEGLYPKNERDAAPYKLPHDYLVRRGIVGLSESSQFAPLTAAAREVNPHLVAAFEGPYGAYRTSVGEAMAKDFFGCDNLVVLVDIPAILEGGPKTYHATRKCIQRLLAVLDPGHTLDSYLWDSIVGGVEKIDNIAIVATKADVIHSSQRHRLGDLLVKLTGDLLPQGSAERWLNLRYFDSVAAVKAAEDMEVAPAMKGFIRKNGVLIDQPQELRPKRDLPKDWPAESGWKAGEYVFGGFLPPPLDANGTEVWPGLGMDPLIAYLGLLSV